MKLHLKLDLWNHYLPVFFDKLWHEFNMFNPSSQLRNLKKKQQTTNTKRVFIRGENSTPRFGQARFLSLGYDGDFSIHRVPWVFLSPVSGNWRGNRNLPFRKKNAVAGGTGFIIFIFFWLMQSICFKLRLLLFRHLSFVVLIFGVCFGFWKLELHEKYVQN